MPKSLTNHAEDLQDAGGLGYITFVGKRAGSWSITRYSRPINPTNEAQTHSTVSIEKSPNENERSVRDL